MGVIKSGHMEYPRLLSERYKSLTYTHKLIKPCKPSLLIVTATALGGALRERMAVRRDQSDFPHGTNGCYSTFSFGNV